MAARRASLLITILATVIVLSSSLIRSSEATGVALYWGQRSNEVSLKAVCSTGLFSYINLAYLTFSDEGPELTLDGHCDSAAGTCRELNEDIFYCQSQGVKILLSIQIPVKRGKQSASQLASYIMQDFLNGNGYGPLGNVSLDGVDFHVETPVPADRIYWNDVADTLYRYGAFTRKIYLAAAPLCSYPDETLNMTIQAGIIDYVSVQFYNNPTCDYGSGGPAGLNSVLGAWKTWSSALPESSQLLMGLPTNPDNVESGYIPPEAVALCVLPEIRTSSNYGGFLLWNVSFLDNSESLPCMVPKQASLIKMFSEN